jgi:hypothetical protein
MDIRAGTDTEAEEKSFASAGEETTVVLSVVRHYKQKYPNFYYLPPPQMFLELRSSSTGINANKHICHKVQIITYFSKLIYTLVNFKL